MNTDTNNEHENGGGADKSAAGGAQCRQSSTRWTPTTEQIRILKDLYYNYGIRSPSADQIQRISAKLRQYGKIEGKNVFYWFQNHKARERQKKRFLSDPPLPPPPPPQSHLAFQPSCPNSISAAAGLSAASSSSAPGLMAFGQMANYGYNSVTMERKFRDFSVSAVGGSSVAGAPIGHNYGWIAVDPYSTSRALFEKRVLYEESAEDPDEGEDEEDEDEEEEDHGRGRETLKLFPMPGDETINGGGYCGTGISTGDHGGWRNEVYVGARTSLELTLNSYSNWATPASP